MSKKEKLRKLAVFIGLKASHEIMIEVTNKPESIKHLRTEADNYGSLGFELAEGKWNLEDLEKIKELAKERCEKKLGGYEDIERGKYRDIETIIEKIMEDLGLV